MVAVTLRILLVNTYRHGDGEALSYADESMSLSLSVSRS